MPVKTKASVFGTQRILRWSIESRIERLITDHPDCPADISLEVDALQLLLDVLSSKSEID